MWPNSSLMIPTAFIALLSGILLGWTLLELSKSPNTASAAVYRSALPPKETALSVATENKPVDDDDDDDD